MRIPILQILTAIGLTFCATSSSASGACEDVDFNGDGVVNDVDIEVFKPLLGTSEGDEGYVAAADLDGSGSITPVDFKMLLSCR